MTAQKKAKQLTKSMVTKNTLLIPITNNSNPNVARTVTKIHNTAISLINGLAKKYVPRVTIAIDTPRYHTG